MKFNTLPSAPIQNVRQMRKPVVLFAIPGGSFTPGFFDSWTKLTMAAGKLPFDMVCTRHYSPVIYHCRANLLGADNRAGEHQIPFQGKLNYDYMMWLDTDINFTPEQVEIRVDANGAFDKSEALNKLNQLTGFKLHSIEQPIQKNNTDSMSELCKLSPIPIALDEELIGVFSVEEKEQLLVEIRPQYIILKPSFVGGFRGTNEWILLAEKHNIKWWITSALESNIGLNAIAQWTFLKQNNMPHGLGTGALYTNNFDCQLEVSIGQLWFKKEKEFHFNFKEN